MTYSVKIDLSRMADTLAQIEAGNPVRFYTLPTLGAAIACCNVARMAGGLGMLEGPRSIKPGDVWQCRNNAVDRVQCEVQRLKKSTGVRA